MGAAAVSSLVPAPAPTSLRPISPATTLYPSSSSLTQSDPNRSSPSSPPRPRPPPPPLSEHPGCKVFGQTASTDHHKNACRVAASNWSGDGSFLFTSSTALYDCSDNGLCNEDCPSVPIGRSPRTDVLLKAENVVLEAGGCVLRLAGLYKIDRGAHVFWLRKGTLDTRPDHIINQIHYEDAASLAIAIMEKRPRSRIFLGCDNKPLSRQEIMDSVNRSGKFDTKFQGFTGTDGPLGKRMENSVTRAEIGWEPEYPSFTEFLGLNN